MLVSPASIIFSHLSTVFSVDATLEKCSCAALKSSVVPSDSLINLAGGGSSFTSVRVSKSLLLPESNTSDTYLLRCFCLKCLLNILTDNFERNGLIKLMLNAAILFDNPVYFEPISVFHISTMSIFLKFMSLQITFWLFVFVRNKIKEE